MRCRTFGYVWDADIPIRGVRAWIKSVGEHELCAWKEVPSAVEDNGDGLGDDELSLSSLLKTRSGSADGDTHRHKLPASEDRVSD